MNPVVLSSHSQDSLMITFLASGLLWLLFAGLAILWLIDGKIKKEQVLHALFAGLIAWTISQMIKSFFPVARPFMIYGSMPMTLTVPYDGSFPSSHTTVAFAIAVSVWEHDKKVGAIFILLAILVAFGRVASGVHFISDVVAGAIIGTLIASLIDRLHLGKIIK